MSPIPIPILTYHQVDAAPPPGSRFRSLVVAPDKFARQMGFLKALGYQGLNMSALLPYLRGEKRGKVVGITFDDGYRNNLMHALPVLQRNGFSATCYCVSQRIGFTNSWDEDSGVAQVPLMNASELREWVGAGQEVGAHTRTHAHLNQLNSVLATEEIAGCKAELEHITGKRINHFCYPYGEFNAEHVALVKEVGFETATTTFRGRAHSADDPLMLPRVPVVRSTALPVFWAKLATPYEDRRRG